MEKKLIKRIVLFLIGILGLAFGIACFIRSSMGTDPFTTLNIGIAQRMHLSFAGVQVIMNILILIAVYLIDKTFIGIGTAISMISIGPLVQYYLMLLKPIDNQEITIVKIIMLVVGCLFVALGAGIYIATHLGVGPYDILPLVIEAKKKLSFKVTRMLLDLGCVILGGILGATVGVGTFIAAICLGPAIEMFRKLTIKYILRE